MTRLTQTEYTRPPRTYQDSLTQEQIKEKLQDHTKVDSISEVPLNTPLRYFTYRANPETKTQERVFRLGGRLINKNHADKYVVLSNGTHSWSVNTATSTFFRPLTVSEVHDRYEKQVNHMRKKIASLETQLGGGGGTKKGK